MWSVLISVCYRDSNSYICWASPWLYELSKCTNKCAWEIPYKEWAKELWDHTATRKSPKPTCCSLWVALCCQGLWAATSVQSLPLSVQPLVCKPPCAATSVQGPVFVFPKLRFSPSCSLTRLFVHSVYTHLLKARYGTVDGDTLSPSLRFSHWLLDHPADWIRFPPSSPLPRWQDLSLSVRQPDVRVIRLTKSLLNWNSLSPHIFISPFPHV